MSFPVYLTDVEPRLTVLSSEGADFVRDALAWAVWYLPAAPLADDVREALGRKLSAALEIVQCSEVNERSRNGEEVFVRLGDEIVSVF